MFWVALPYSVSRRQQNSKTLRGLRQLLPTKCWTVYWRVRANQRRCKNKQQRRQKRDYCIPLYQQALKQAKWLFTRENDGGLDLVEIFLYICVKVLYIWKLLNVSEEIMQALDFDCTKLSCSNTVHTFLFFFYKTLNKTKQDNEQLHSLYSIYMLYWFPQKVNFVFPSL